MKAIMLSEFGDENVMTLAEVPDLPAPEGDSVRIKVAAAGVNRADLLQRQGHYPPPAGESDILGLEVSGTIDALGPDELVALLNASEAFYYATVERVEYSGWLAQLLTAFRKTPPPARAR